MVRPTVVVAIDALVQEILCHSLVQLWVATGELVRDSLTLCLRLLIHIVDIIGCIALAIELDFKIVERIVNEYICISAHARVKLVGLAFRILLLDILRLLLQIISLC